MPRKDNTKRRPRPTNPVPDHERRPRHAITDFVGVSADTDTHKDWITIAQAIRDIVTNDVTPSRLYNDVMGFLNDHSSDLWNDLMKSPEIILRILIIASTNEEKTEATEGGGK